MHNTPRNLLSTQRLPLRLPANIRKGSIATEKGPSPRLQLPISTRDVIGRRRRADIMPAGVDAVDDGVEPGVADSAVAEQDVRGPEAGCF
jgi:hypothetical protein